MPDALKRDEKVDYRHGWFFVTINTRDYVPVLSTCEGDPSIPDGEEGAPVCRYTPLGIKIIENWKSIPSFHSGASVDSIEAMPDHIHGLIYLKPENTEHLGHIIRGFMIACSHAYWDILEIRWRDGHPTEGRQLPGGTPPDRRFTDRDHTHSLRGPALFVHGYNDTEPITEKQVATKRAYIKEQARKRLIQGKKHRCLIKYRNNHSKNWTEKRPLLANASDDIKARLKREASGLVLDYMGSWPLMAAKNKLPLVCHRKDAKLFEEQKEAVMTAARNGAVIVGAFISPREKEIREALITELLPIIEIVDNGFTERYKPSGKAFYAMAEGRLTQISCWEYRYEKDFVITREMCLVMNELARVISGKRDDWWK